MKLMKKIKIKRFIISLFLSFIFFTTYLNANSLNNLVVLETLNSQNRFEYSGFFVNKSSIPIYNISVRFVAKGKNGEVVEARSVSLLNDKSYPLNPGERLNFSFVIDSNPKEIYTKKLYFYN